MHACAVALCRGRTLAAQHSTRLTPPHTHTYTTHTSAGPALIPRINAGLAELLAKDGHTSISQAVGKEAAGRWGGGKPLGQ